ncbi:retention module-containing protein, partial [Accumulibacter sp.]
MAEKIPVARVSAIQGKAFVREADGTLRPLQVGDMIYEGDIVVTAQGSRVDLASPDNRPLVLRENETLTVDENVFGTVRPDATDAALVAGASDVNRVIKAIREGGSLDELLEDPAAGPAAGGAGGADGGPTFVRLLRIVENVDPLTFDFGTARGTLDDTAPAGIAGTTDAPAETVATTGPTAVPPTLNLVAANNTNDSTPTITGSTNATPGSTVTLTVTDAAGIVQTLTAVVQADGSFSATPGNTLADGGYNVVASVTDPAGGTGTASGGGTVDTTAPTISVVAPSNTNDNTPTITGTTDAAPGSTVTLT